MMPPTPVQPSGVPPPGTGSLIDDLDSLIGSGSSPPVNPTSTATAPALDISVHSQHRSSSSTCTAAVGADVPNFGPIRRRRWRKAALRCDRNDFAANQGFVSMQDGLLAPEISPLAWGASGLAGSSYDERSSNVISGAAATGGGGRSKTAPNGCWCCHRLGRCERLRSWRYDCGRL